MSQSGDQSEIEPHVNQDRRNKFIADEQSTLRRQRGSFAARGVIMQKYVLVIVMWLVLVAVFGGAGYILVRPATSQTLRDNPIVTQGRVIAKEPHNHRIIRYSYTVDGQTYTGIGHGGGGNPKFEDLAIGNLVRVVYNSKNPSESFMGYPEHDLQVNRAGAVFLALVPPTLISLTMLGILILVSRTR